VTTPLPWARTFPFVDRPGEPLLQKCKRITEELAYCRAHAEPAHNDMFIDFTEPRRDEE
jgi:hypothetical protein